MSASKSGKKVLGLIKLQIPAGSANPSPPVGPALGQRGLNIMDFCKQFNEKTKDMEKGIPVPVVITAYVDKSFTFIVKNPPVSYYVKKHAGLAKGCSTPGRESAGKIAISAIEEIAKIKFDEMGVSNMEAAMETIKGTARSMGIDVAE